MHLPGCLMVPGGRHRASNHNHEQPAGRAAPAADQAGHGSGWDATPASWAAWLVPHELTRAVKIFCASCASSVVAIISIVFYVVIIHIGCIKSEV